VFEGAIPDTEQIPSKALMKRKVKLVLTKMNPKKVKVAIASIYKSVDGCIGCPPVQFKFARTIALSLTISDFFQRFINRFIFLLVDMATSTEYKKWSPVLTD